MFMVKVTRWETNQMDMVTGLNMFRLNGYYGSKLRDNYGCFQGCVEFKPFVKLSETLFPVAVAWDQRSLNWV